MKFTKKELEIIAHSLALHVEEMTNEKTRKTTESMLGKMQSEGIWGHADFGEE
tara:strand:- start:679 stop:837 length:159 start_codon:yes stop_codon:yes gene_type:complete